MDAGSSGSVPTKEGRQHTEVFLITHFPSLSLWLILFCHVPLHQALQPQLQAKLPLRPKLRQDPKPRYEMLENKRQRQIRKRAWRRRHGSRNKPGEEEDLRPKGSRKRPQFPPKMWISRLLLHQKTIKKLMARKWRRVYCHKSKQCLPRPKSISERSRARRKRAEIKENRFTVERN